MIILACATMIVCAASAQSMTSPQSNADRVDPRAALSVSNDLLRDSENPGSIDIQSMLRDDRRVMPPGIWPADHAPLSPALLSNFGAKSLRPAEAPHIQTPLSDSDGASGVNDRLVPVPVINTGWAIVLCTVMFRIGARVLRFRRTVAR